MRKKEEMAEIIKLISMIQYEISAYDLIGMYDINKYSEDLFCGLLNIVFDYNLVNLNYQRLNQEYVDLGDIERGVYVQVTSKLNTKKVDEKITGISNNEAHFKCRRLIFFVIGKKKPKINKTWCCSGWSFDPKKDILDIDDLIKAINSLSDEHRYKVLVYLRDQHEDKQARIRIEDVEREKLTIIDNYIERRVCKLSNFKEHYISETSWEDLYGVLKSKSRIVLVSDAGYGKSELCKRVVNIINEKDKADLYAFYYRLNNYTDQNIKDLLPLAGQSLPLSSVVFVLDAFDEIYGSSKSIFIRKLNDFVIRNKDTRIIISCRTNFFRLEHFREFEAYILEVFDLFVINSPFNDGTLSRELVMDWAIQLPRVSRAFPPRHSAGLS